jgi:hypothetical protein
MNKLPSNFGQKWTNEEECMLLEELSKGNNIEIIASNHNRTKGGIISRQRLIAYNMYLKNNSMDEIINKTKLSEDSIKQTIFKRENSNKRKEPNELKDNFMEEIINKRKEPNELKDLNKIHELVIKLYLTLNFVFLLLVFTIIILLNNLKT